MTSRPRLTPFSNNTLQSMMTDNSIAFSPPPPPSSSSSSSSPLFIANNNQNHHLIKHDITTLVSLKHRQIEDLEQKIENLQRDLTDSDQLRLRWMERCSKLEEQLVDEGSNHTRELATSNQNCIKFKSELYFVLKKLKEDDQQEEFFESIGALSLAEEVRERRRLRVEQRQKERQRGGNNNTPHASSSPNNHNTNNNNSSVVRILNDDTSRFATGEERNIIDNNNTSPRTKYILTTHHNRGQEISTSISPYRFSGENVPSSSSPSRHGRA